MQIQKTNSYHSRLVFGTTREKTTDGNRIKNWLHTDFSRNDVAWPRFIDDLVNRYPNGAKIHCFACSDGSEAYTIALKLIQKLGLKKAQKFFPISAKDIDNKRIEKNNRGIIGLRKTIDIPEIKRCLKKSGLLFNDLVEPANIPPEKVFGVHNYEIGQYKIKGLLKDFIKFEAADIVEDSKKKFPKDSVVLCRNVVPYLDPEQEKQLIQNLSTNLKPNSMVAIGGFDQNYSYFGEHLIDSKFIAVDINKPIVSYRKELKGAFPLGIKYRENPSQAGLFIKEAETKILLQIKNKLRKI